MDFPPWAPVDVIESWRINVPNADWMVPFLTDERMKWVWARIKKINNKDAIEIDFIMAILHGLNGPIGKVERMTRGERADFIADTKLKLTELTALIKDTELDWLLIKSRNKQLIDATNSADWEKFNCICGGFQPMHLSLLFREIIDNIELFVSDTGNRSLIMLDRPNTDYATRQYFIQTLTMFCLDRFGSPQRRIVARVASVAFQQEISQRVVIRLAPAPDT